MTKQNRISIPHLDGITGTKVIKFFDDGQWKILVKLDTPLFTTEGIMVDFIATTLQYTRPTTQSS